MTQNSTPNVIADDPPEALDIEQATADAHIRAESDESHYEPDAYTFHPSQLSDECPWLTIASKLKLETIRPEYCGAAAVGTEIHEFFETVVSKELPDRVKFEHPVNYRAGDVVVTGHVDVWDPQENVVYDFKTKDSLEDANPPYDSHLIQTALYAHGLGATHAAIIYVSRSNLSLTHWPNITGYREDSPVGSQFVEVQPERVMAGLRTAHEAKSLLDEHGFPEAPEDMPIDRCNYPRCWCEIADLKDEFDHFPSGDPDSIPTTTEIPERPVPGPL